MSSKMLAAKLQTVLEMRTDSPALLVSLEAISTFFEEQHNQGLSQHANGGSGGHGALDARRSLREDLERQNYNLTTCFLKSFENLKGRLEGLEHQVESLEGGCRSISDRLAAADTSMRQFTDRASALRAQRDELSRRSQQAAQFLERFQLSEEDAIALGARNNTKSTRLSGNTTNSSEPVLGVGDSDADSAAFFTALRKLMGVHAECSQLVGAQGAGFELLDALSQDLENAFERLYHWVQDRCQRQLGEENTPLADATLQTAVKVLRARPVYHAHCQESIVAIRRKLVSQRFAIEFTSPTGHSGVRREMISQDPVRDVGDTLAWVHQTAAVERELLGTLFGNIQEEQPEGAPDVSYPHGRTDVVAASGEGDPSSAPSLRTVAEIVSRVMEGMVKPLRARISTLLMECTDAVLAYRLIGYIAFYSDMVGRMIDTESPLGVAIAECRGEAYQRFRSLLSTYAAKITSSPAVYSSDLTPLPVVVEGSEKVRGLLKMAREGLAPSGSPEGETALETALESLVDPLVTLAQRSAKGMDHCDGAILILNNLHTIQEALPNTQIGQESGSAAVWSERLSLQCTAWLDALIKAQVEKELERCSLAPILRACASGVSPVSQAPGMDVNTVSRAMSVFYGALFGMNMPEFQRIQDTTIRDKARRVTAKQVSAAYASVYKLITSSDAGYADTSFLVHTPAQVSIILDCDG